MTEKQVFDVRIALIQAFLEENGHDGVLLSRPDNFAMATGGKRNYVYTYSDAGANSLLVTRGGGAFYVGDNVEETRQMAEELGGLGCEVLDFLWFEDTAASVARKRFGGNLVSDDGAVGRNVHGELAPLRALLTGVELEKYRRLGALAAEAMNATLDVVEAGMAEADIAACLVAEGIKRRCQVPVALVAADKRIARFRHPLPTEKGLVMGGQHERAALGYVMIVGCFLKEGLVASLTRFKQVGAIPARIPESYARVCGVDAIMQESTQPGVTLGDVFKACQRAYADLGFAENEWHNHHQGGAAGYAGRTCKGSPTEPFPILDGRWASKASAVLGNDVEFGMAFAWNPSAPGVKSEDTFLLYPDGRKEIVTSTPSLPQVNLEHVLGRETEVVKSGIAE